MTNTYKQNNKKPEITACKGNYFNNRELNYYNLRSNQVFVPLEKVEGMGSGSRFKVGSLKFEEGGQTLVQVDMPMFTVLIQPLYPNLNINH